MYHIRTKWVRLSALHCLAICGFFPPRYQSHKKTSKWFFSLWPIYIKQLGFFNLWQKQDLILTEHNTSPVPIITYHSSYLMLNCIDTYYQINQRKAPQRCTWCDFWNEKETHPWFKLLIKVKTADEHDVIWKNALLMIHKRENIFRGAKLNCARRSFLLHGSDESTEYKVIQTIKNGGKGWNTLSKLREQVGKTKLCSEFSKNAIIEHHGRNKFHWIHCQGRSPNHLTTGCLVSSDTNLVLGFVLVFFLHKNRNQIKIFSYDQKKSQLAIKAPCWSQEF